MRVLFCRLQLGVVARVLVCETSGRGFEPHTAWVSQTHFTLKILCAEIIYHNLRLIIRKMRYLFHDYQVHVNLTSEIRLSEKKLNS